ncbi:MAG: hypothetical protein OSA98_13475 [Rubripirellula sp.]|nr:hypothetical protein [Rubripirellula sp.]
MRFCFALLMISASVCCTAQQPRPPLEPNVLLAEISTSDLFASCDAIAAEEVELSRFKRQALQSVSLSGGYMGDVGGSGLSSRYVDLSIGSGIPLGSFDNIVGVKPRFRVDWIDADSSIDIPSQLYQFEVQFFYRRPIHDRLSAMAIFSPSVRSDLTTSDNAFRVFALGLLNWECIPDRLTLSGGAVYLGRADLPVLPAIGMVWTPSRLTRLDLRFPTSKLSRRLAKDGGRSETWAYLSAGLGGNTWAVTRSSMTTDEVSLRDLSLRMGIEKIVNGGGGCFADAGYAFSRRLEYENDDSEVKLDDAILFRCGWSY